MPVFAIIFAATLSLSACTGGAPDSAETGMAGPTETEDREAIMAQSHALSQAYMDGDIERLIQVYAEDGIAAPAGREFIQGREALTRLWVLPEGRTVLEHASVPDELVIDGDHAYDRGHYHGQAAQDGEPMDPFGGAYTIIWERGSDGVWRIVVDMWYNLPVDG